MNGDVINAGFEFAGALANFASVRALWKAKEVKGVHWGQFAFYLTWGAWNLFFYPANGFLWSFIGGIAIMSSNVAWLLLVLYFWHQRKKVIHA